MSASRKPLTPYDRMFLGSHLAQQQMGLPGHACFAVMELRGRLDAASLSQRIQESLALEPVLRGRIEYSRLSGRAYWSMKPLGEAANPIECHDLSADSAAEDTFHELLQRAWRIPFEPAVSPPIHWMLFHTPDEQSRLVLLWPHYLMDMEGARRWLRVVGGETNASAPIHEPAEWSGQKLRRWLQWLNQWKHWAFLKSCRLPGQSTAGGGSIRLARRHWPDDALAQITRVASQVCSPGPRYLTRWYLIALLRTMHDLHDELGYHDHPSYLLPYPMALSRPNGCREIACNDLTIATLCIERRMIEQPRALDAALMEQLSDYTRLGREEATWIGMRYAGLFRANHYRWFIRRHLAFPRYSMGFTSFRADPWPRSFLGCNVRNLYGNAMPTLPPGMLVSFCRYGERLSTVAAYAERTCTQQLADKCLNRIGEHLGLSSINARRPTDAAQLIHGSA